MRRTVAGLVVAVALLLPACSDQPTEVTPGSETAAPGGAGVVAPVESCPASSIESQIKALAPPGGLRTSLLAQFKSIPSKVGQRTGTAARDKMFALVDAILDAYYAGRFGGTSTAIQAKVLTLISSLYCFVRLDSPTLPEGSLGEDGVVGVVTPNSPTTTLAVPSAHAAVTIPAGAAPVPTMIVIHILPDEPGPLLTSLDQYPFFYEFSAFPDVTFNLDLLAGICPRDNLDEIDANLRLAHNVGPNFGDVEVLPRPTGAVPGLDCSDLGGEEGPSFLRTSSRSGLGVDDDGWSSMRRALAPLVSALLPEPLHAATLLLATTGVGGTTKKFSPFGIVDIFSNPGSFAPVGPTEATEEGGTVTRTVLVTSANGDSIVNVPVTFSTEEGNGDVMTPQPVLTNPDGEASVSWALPEGSGVYTLHASVPEDDNDPFETTDPPEGNSASTPDVAFTPQSLTFTVTVPGGIGYQATGWRYLVSNTSGVFPLSISDFDEAGYNDTEWSTGNAGFGEDGGNECPLNQDAQATEWPIGTQILLRKPFTVPAGAGSVEVKVAIDNDIQVFVNGANVTGTGGEPDESGFLIHDDCPTLDSFTFTAPVTSGVNWLAIRGRDRGGSSYVDAKVVPVIEEGGE